MASRDTSSQTSGSEKAVAPPKRDIRTPPRPRSTVPRTPARRSLMERLQGRGARGGVIPQHRAMVQLRAGPWLLADMVLLPAALTLGVFAALDPLMQAWRWMLETMRVFLDLPGTVATRVVELAPFLTVAVPHLTVDTLWPDRRALTIGWIATAALALAGMLFRGRFTPLAYLLRALAVVQLSAQLFFAFTPPPFPYALPVYHSGFLACGVVVLLLIPFLVGGTFFVFGFSLWRKLALVLMLLLHLAVLFPLQSMVHVWWIWHGSFLAMPVLFLVFGLLLDVFVYVALYGWGMSWRTAAEVEDMRLARVRRPVAPVVLS